ncbi:hypothetical protein MSG28_011477 [Choristoneura fumiferana]|uniref:Uncharacterized protein n=2 Tax=Choristoneura fumiferana TaxID=7141 RepID=A0ACC0JP46_CHOFU|nr:HSP18.6 [Choristoneura fumiferana]KAI8425665.1 hypothetical protein MSG28_011477 [Choristoneura fumiferana]
MIISRILRLSVLPTLKHTRNIRPTIKIGKERFQLQIDVHQFSKDEIRVKARPEFVLIEGKQERKTKRGCIIRQFARRFKLPPGCNPGKMKSSLSPEGVLTIVAPRETCDMNLPCETMVPIDYTGKQAEESIVDVQTKETKESQGDFCKKIIGAVTGQNQKDKK